MMADRYAVVGSPVSHSKSPWIHHQFAVQTGDDLTYTAIEAPTDGFRETVERFFAQGGSGLNITLPFKEEAYALADRLTDRAKHAGAVNTLYRDAQDCLLGDNTDGAGLMTDLGRNHGVQTEARRILVLGAGGAVRGILAPLLAQHPAEVVVANRTLARAEALAQRFGGHGVISASGFEAVEGAFDLVINGTSASLAGELPPIPDSTVKGDTFCYDMMYSPDTTVFNRWAQARGAAQALDGLGMLVEQAAESFYLWRGRRPDTHSVIQMLRLG